MKTLSESKQPEVPAEFVNAAAVARKYGVCSRYILMLAEQGRIPCLRLGAKCVRFRLADVATALEGTPSADRR